MKRTVYIIYKPGCPYSERAINILAWYKENFPREIDIYILPTKSSQAVASFCNSCGLCSGSTFPQIWIDDYSTSFRKSRKFSDCVGYIGGCNDLMQLMNDLQLPWNRAPGQVAINWRQCQQHSALNKLVFSDKFENFFLLEPPLYFWT